MAVAARFCRLSCRLGAALLWPRYGTGVAWLGVPRSVALGWIDILAGLDRDLTKEFLFPVVVDG